MGTNYYLTSKSCECCGRRGDRIHIGKSSIGWCFGLHVYRDGVMFNGKELTIADLKDWIPLMNAESAQIEDEYGDVIPVVDMLSRIRERSRGNDEQLTDEFLRRNQAIRGPNGLLRADMDHPYAAGFTIGYGAGTWDLHTGTPDSHW